MTTQKADAVHEPCQLNRGVAEMTASHTLYGAVSLAALLCCLQLDRHKDVHNVCLPDPYCDGSNADSGTASVCVYPLPAD